MAIHARACIQLQLRTFHRVRPGQVLSVHPAAEGFHARESCVGKRYVYTIQEGRGSPLTSRYRWALGKERRLDVAQMNEAAARLIGTHDFSTFGVRDATAPSPCSPPAHQHASAPCYAPCATFVHSYASPTCYIPTYLLHAR